MTRQQDMIQALLSGNFDLYGDDSNLGMYDDEPWN